MVESHGILLPTQLDHQTPSAYETEIIKVDDIEDLPSNHYPSWCWHVGFNGPTPRDYNEKYGALEVNMLNQGMIRRARCKQGI